jgi:hypothetical protein
MIYTLEVISETGNRFMLRHETSEGIPIFAKKILLRKAAALKLKPFVDTVAETA